MANFKKVDRNKNKKKESYVVHAKLDAETLAIWNATKHSENMSRWIRMMLRFHFGRNLSSNQKNQLLRERIGILNMEKDREEERIRRDFNAEIMKLQQMMSTDEVSLIINSTGQIPRSDI